jgi:hypothetical protein
VSLLSAFVLVVFGVATAVASGGDASMVHACVSTGSGDDDDEGSRKGSVRIVGATEGCSRYEVHRHWSITGPQGLQGLQGAPA